MTTKVTPLGLRLFLEGVEVPVISAQVNAAPDQPATAAIQVVPTDMGLHLLPRTLVHLFYLDIIDENDPIDDPPRQAEDGSYQEANFNRFDAPDKRYKILFTGEVSGFNYGKTPDSRQLILQCHDLSTYWDTCYQWFADYSVGGGGLTDKHQFFVGAGTSLFNSVAGGHKWVIGQIMSERPVTPAYRETPGLLGAIIHLLETIGGTPGIDGFNGVNDFFSIAQLRYNLIGMIGALAADDTSARIYNQKAFFDWLRNGMTSMGSVMSFRDIINHVCRYIYHHIYPNPCSYYVPKSTRTDEVPVTVFRDDPIGTAIIEKCKRVHTSLARASNNILVNDVLNVRQTFLFILSARNLVREARIPAQILKTDDQTYILNSLNSVESILSNAVSLIQGEGFDYSTPKDVSFDFAPQLDSDIGDALKILEDEILSVVKESTRVRTKKETRVDIGASLHNQLILPECYFVSPPRCNVLFPDQYFQFSFSRNFMREVSRLSMASGLGMIAGGGRQGSKLFTRSYFAPNIRDSRNKHVFATTSRGARILLPHEIHSGIIPKYEWANDGHRWANLAKKKGKDPFFSDGKVGYLQRLANFQFYLHRWSARTMAVTGVFNPHLVIGFPGLVIDQSLPNPEVLAQREELLGRKWMPVQYLGKMVALSHSINQGGGQTSVQFTHCRTHKGLDDEFLSTLSREIQEKKTEQVKIDINVRQLLSSSGVDVKNRRDKNALVRGFMEGTISVGKPVVGTRAWRGYKVGGIDADFVTTELTGAEAAELGIFPDTMAVVEREAVFGAGKGPFDTAVETKIVEEEVTILNMPTTFKFILERRVNVGKPQIRKETVEQQLTPGWFADLWTNENISSKVYQPLLGTDAIVENISLDAKKQDEFFKRVVKDENVVIAQDPPEGEAEKKTFSFAEAQKTEADLATIEVIPGSIEEAIDAIVTIYSTVRLNEGNLHEFIRQYTKRPVANMEEILGTYGLEFDDNGFVLEPANGEVAIEGFHSRAFGDYNTDVKLPKEVGQKTLPGAKALKALFVGSPGADVARGRITNQKEKKTISPSLDPRGRARTRVLAYVRELNLSRGLMG